MSVQCVHAPIYVVDLLPVRKFEFGLLKLYLTFESAIFCPIKNVKITPPYCKGAGVDRTGPGVGSTGAGVSSKGAGVGSA